MPAFRGLPIVKMLIGVALVASQLGSGFVVASAILLSQVEAQSTAQATSAVLSVLSKRHMDETNADLERIAGGRENLIRELLVLRNHQGLPYVGVRAAKFLTAYADSAEVEAAIKEDLRASDRSGLARVYAIQIDKISSADARHRVAQAVLEKGQDQPDYAHFARNLLYSSDQEVKKMAQKAFP